MTISKKVKKIRGEQRLTQEAFGELLGVARNHITDVERGRVFPNIAMLENLHNKLKINLNWLLVDKSSGIVRYDYKMETDKSIVHDNNEKYITESLQEKYIISLEKNEQLREEIDKLRKENKELKAKIKEL